MPEAFAVLLIFVVAVAAYVGARLSAADPAKRDAKAELARLRNHRTSLEERLILAKKERWEPEMQERIFEALTFAEAQLTECNSAGLDLPRPPAGQERSLQPDFRDGRRSRPTPR